MPQRRLMAVLAHPDDETLGFGGTLAACAASGVDVHLVTATRGESGRYHGFRPGDGGHPGVDGLGRIREAELRAAAGVLGVREVALLDYRDQQLDRADAARVVADIAGHLRRVRPDVVVTFGPDGAYGHPDHVAISQFTTAAVVAAAAEMPSHAVSKLYYLAWPAATWAAYQAAFKTLTFAVDGVDRRAVAWPDWAITTSIDARHLSETVNRAIACHASQTSIYRSLGTLGPEHRDAMGIQSFYRVFSAVNGGRARETDLFEGLRA